MPADPLWQPDDQRIAGTAMAAFRADQGFDDAASLHAWSVAEPGAFWDSVFSLAVRHGARGTGPAVVATETPPGARFYDDARFCYAEELLTGDEHPGAGDSALIYRREDGWREEWTWNDLRAAVAACAAQLSAAGVGPGHRVAAWLPNAPEAVVTALATNWLGAVYTSASPDFGPAALADRFAQVAPTVLVAADGYVYAGRNHDRTALLPEIIELLPSVSTVLLVSELDRGADLPLAQFRAVLPGRITVAALSVKTRPGDFPPVAHQQTATDPGFILYSSGTTGKPKCIVHSAMGLTVKHWTEHVLHCDIRPGDRVFFFTTCGWMMWNWLVGTLAAGATVVLYDGSPLAPDPGHLWRMAAQERVSFFGAGAKFYDACRKAGVRPSVDVPDLRLRTIAATGSPLSAEDFEFLYRDVSADVHVASISGGTDICGCFVLGDPTLPVYAGEIQVPALGADVDVIDSAGGSLKTAPGTPGDLVCRNALPSMPLGFWGDDDATAYRHAYFEANPGMWTHGDFALWTDHDGVIITGRSDATLNAGGVRIGTAEIYRQVVHFPEVADALAVGQQHDDDTRVVLFVQMVDGVELDDELRGAIRARLRRHASPRHVPAVVVAVADLPRTRSGKLAELAVADVVNGRAVRAASGLANPESLALFADLPELRA